MYVNDNNFTYEEKIIFIDFLKKYNIIYIVEEYFCYQKIILLHFCKVSVTDVILVFGNRKNRGVVKFGMALALGARYRGFKSLHPDHYIPAWRNG